MCCVFTATDKRDGPAFFSFPTPAKLCKNSMTPLGTRLDAFIEEIWPAVNFSIFPERIPTSFSDLGEFKHDIFKILN
jgi:hypothetical protein